MSRISVSIPNNLQSRLCLLGDQVLQEIPFHFNELWPRKTAVIIADENTWEAAGQTVYSLMETAGIEQAAPVIFPGSPALHADMSYIPQLVQAASGKIPIAVGSGTINDLTKLASTEASCGGYLCVATAASVDGYTSFGAAMTVNGFKKTVPCAAPLAIIVDNAVAKTAPFAMTASGYADLAAKVPGGAEWIIADMLGEQPIDSTAWNMVQTNLKEWLSNPQGLKAGESKPLEDLFNGLFCTGFAMQYYHDSRPASGSEHLCSHAWEMFDLKKDGVNPSHGFKVGLGTLISTAIMTELFAFSKDELRRLSEQHPAASRTECEAEIARYLQGTCFYDDARNITLDKHLEGQKLTERRQLIYDRWDAMRERVLRQMIPYQDLKQRFAILGCPLTPEDIGTTFDETRRIIHVASMIRKRYTSLDLLVELGLLDTMIDIIFAKGYLLP